jgi:TPR repeat protein
MMRPHVIRYSLAILLVAALCSTPSWAGIKEGVEAATRGDDATAFNEWHLLAEHGDATAQTNIGSLYLNGHGVPQDYDEAFKWFWLAAAQGNPLAYGKVGQMYEAGQGVAQDYIEAYKWYSLADAQGEEEAASLRDVLAKEMTSHQIAEAQRLAREWKPKSRTTSEGWYAELRGEMGRITTLEWILTIALVLGLVLFLRWTAGRKLSPSE